MVPAVKVRIVRFFALEIPRWFSGGRHAAGDMLVQVFDVGTDMRMTAIVHDYDFVLCFCEIGNRFESLTKFNGTVSGVDADAELHFFRFCCLMWRWMLRGVLRTLPQAQTIRPAPRRFSPTNS